ncbi:MAG: Zn-dependent hydrolase [Lysobacterales bacterium]|nr:MAG: Zn-dependent hydrolase [Xanthomonadales bacterium]
MPCPAFARLLLFLPLVGLTLADDGRVIPELRSDEARIERHILELSAFGANPGGGVSRVAFSQADVDGREYIRGLMLQAGLEVRIDTAGNLIGRRPGNADRGNADPGSPTLPPILIGSHIDSVPGGGNYDGNVGVIGAIEVAQVLHESGTRLRHPLEVAVFADEEGGLSGSRAMIGKLGPQALQAVSHSGLTIADGIRAIGGDPERLTEARRQPGDLAAFVELHIEQGAVLYDEGVDIGVVTGIVGIQWWEVIVTGVANHAGTTPMDKRQDALLAAAELILAVNRVITAEPGAQVGTVGRIAAEPGAPNVIPGRVVMSLELRDLSSETMLRVYRGIEAEALAIAGRSGTTIEFRHVDMDASPAPTDGRIRDLIAAAAANLGLSHKAMPSGAGHDAQDLAQIAPTGMIFVPSVAGVSHSPLEFTRPRDIANGANMLLHTVLAIDRGSLEQ